MESVWPWVLAFLGGLLLVSGIDDLGPLLICVYHRFMTVKAAPPFSIGEFLKQERRIAVFVPCWKEAEVISDMVRHNLAAIRYRNFHFFLGAYPNDEATVAVVEHLAKSLPNVHVAACPHPGPTSKADCLNWIYQRMALYEEEQGTYFDTIALHDAEDLIHPDAFSIINRERSRYSMIQIPVLPLPTPFQKFTHGVYCDEFSEFQMIDMHARQFSGSFIPSSGVGTAFARELLDSRANERDNQVFDPASLTEDYEIGVYVHMAGYSQLFAPVRRSDKDFVATREYFPRRLRSAIRQRTRWVTGIALQCWERHGWRGPWRNRYWFWRDRKGLIANPIGLLTNLLFVAGAADWLASAAVHCPWIFAVTNPKLVALCWATLSVQCFRLAVRMVCVAEIFGIWFACGVPLRCIYGNFINSCAAFGALAAFVKAKVQRRPLVWLKTDHAYPSRDALLARHRELSDVLVSSGYISEDTLAAAQARVPPGSNLADFLVENNLISDEDLCNAMSLQSGVPSACIDPKLVKARVARTLPAHIEKRFGVVPYRVQSGRLFVAGSRLPSSQEFEQLRAFSPLPIEFQLVSKRNYMQLRELL